MTQTGYMVYRVLIQADNVKNFMPDFMYSKLWRIKKCTLIELKYQTRMYVL